MKNANGRCGQTRSLTGTVLVCGVAALSLGCSEDTNDSAEPALDAAVADAAAEGEAEGGIDDAAVPDSPGIDAAIVDAGALDGSTSEPRSDAGDAGRFDSGAMDAAFDTTASDAQVFVPDGGAVLRPTELAFDAARLDQLEVEEGFKVNVFAVTSGKARMLAEHGGAIYVTRPTQGDVLRLADTDADGAADTQTTAVSGLDTVHGIVFSDENTVYLATPTQVIRATVGEDGSFSGSEVLIDDLPDGGQHPLRTLGIGPDNLLYISVGSSCDACDETNPEHATLLQAALDGSSRTVFASGLRNTLGFGWHPSTQDLWGVDNGSDWRGNELPPEELNLLIQGNHYGWPYCYGMQEVDPVIADPIDQSKAAFCQTTTPAVLINQAHEAPIGMAFYDATAFPEEYQGDAFVAMRGSWNRIPATGYKIVRIDFDDAGQPVAIEDFVAGFLDDTGLATFARPAGVTVAGDGSLVFSDDTNGVLYRVSVQP